MKNPPVWMVPSDRSRERHTLGHADEQRRLFYGIQLEDLVPADHPLRRIRPLIDTEREPTGPEEDRGAVGRSEGRTRLSPVHAPDAEQCPTGSPAGGLAVESHTPGGPRSGPRMSDEEGRRNMKDGPDCIAQPSFFIRLLRKEKVTSWYTDGGSSC